MTRVRPGKKKKKKRMWGVGELLQKVRVESKISQRKEVLWQDLRYGIVEEAHLAKVKGLAGQVGTNTCNVCGELCAARNIIFGIQPFAYKLLPSGSPLILFYHQHNSHLSVHLFSR